MTTQQEAARHIDVSRQLVGQLLDRYGLPRKGFNLDELRVAYIRDLREKAAGRGSDGEYDLTAERARLSYHQANVEQLKEAQLRGELIPVDAVLAAWQEKIGATRAQLLSLPTRASPLVIAETNATQAEQIIKRIVHEALDELAGSGLPPEFETRLAAIGRGLDSSTGSDAERMGGKRVEAKSGG